MNTIVQNYKENFVKENGLDKSRKYVIGEEYAELLKKYKSRATKNEVLENYEVEEDESYNIKFFTEVPEEISEDELSKYISMKTVEKLNGIDYKVNIIKNIMIVLLLLTILGILGSLVLR